MTQANLIPFRGAVEAVKPKVIALTTPAGNQTALKMLALVIGSYRTSYDDQRVFARQAAAALEDFPPDVLNDLASPKVGIIRELKFAPSVAELVAWCERRLAEKISAAADTPEQKAAVYHAAKAGEGWARAYFRVRGIEI